MPETTTSKPLNLFQLIQSLPDAGAMEVRGNAAGDGEKWIRVEGVSQADLDSAVAEHEADFAIQPPPDVPDSVALWRLKVVLQIAGMMDLVTSVMGALPEPERTVARGVFDNGNEIERRAQLLGLLGSACGLSEEQVDGLFFQAASIQV